MGCFTTCFGTCKRSRRRRRRPVKTSPSSLLHHTYESVEGFQVPQLTEEQGEVKEKEAEQKGENQIELTPDSKEEKLEKANSSERKKVTFDLNVRIYEDFRTEEEVNDDFDEDEEEEEEEEVQIKKGKGGFGIQCNSDSSSSSLFSFPTDHRYQNCRDSDDEFDDLVSSDESENDDDDYYTDDEDEEVESEVKNDKHEQSSESLFSLSLDSRKQGIGSETGDKEVNSPMPIKNSSPNESNTGKFDHNAVNYVESVLNPVENLSQWKFIKARSKLASKDQSQAKENIISGQDFSFPVKKAVVSELEVGVDTSLSSWLMCSEGTPKNNSRNSSVSVGNSPSDRKTVSPNKFEDRPILGALTLEELRQHSATTSPRKSPSKSPEEMPIIGTVGSYWSHTAQTTDSGSSTTSTKSRFRESAEVIWDATPFETRLEKALEKEGNSQQNVFEVHTGGRVMHGRKSNNRILPI
ncbi:uncharacterized protein [Spinacia oleracea]|uniref:Uncharacterized protein isoform X2 n=1 Tax=Spinacia oleracea TaxID=3562 RepID=A0A9R0KAR3_SPIOL|nr:uncharacterized protein LOC110803547 isoform X2 [Spinacia oleracea]